MVALSLLFVSWAIGLGEVYRQSQSSLLAQWIGLAYPIGDIVILTVLFVAFRRSPPAHRGRLAILVVGLAANAFSDSAFAFLTASGSYLTSSYLFSTGWIYGYALVALAPLWPQRPTAATEAAEGPITVARMMLPWLGLIAVVGQGLVPLSQTPRTVPQPQLACRAEPAAGDSSPASTARLNSRRSDSIWLPAS